MIAYLSGEIRDKHIDNIIIDVHGVGYGVFVTREDLSALELDKSARLFIYEHIREQSYDFFGFIKKETKELFEKLLEVNGVGPKMAISMLNLASSEKLKRAIAEGDTKFIQGASGVGKRLAERVVVDLKDKVGLISSDSATDFLQEDSSDEAVQALTSLGFSVHEASEALRGIDKKLSLEEKIKQALRSRQ